jgi:hypothetical protein
VSRWRNRGTGDLTTHGFRASQRAFFGVSALLFAASAAVTIVWCVSMSAMGETDGRRRWRAVLIAIGVAVLIAGDVVLQPVVGPERRVHRRPEHPEGTDVPAGDLLSSQAAPNAA